MVLKEAAKDGNRLSSVLNSKIYNGGPVESIGVLHNIMDLPGTTAAQGVKFTEGHNFHVWRHHITQPLKEKESLRMFLGECTWSAGQLLDELKQGCWIMCKPNSDELDLLRGDTSEL